MKKLGKIIGLLLSLSIIFASASTIFAADNFDDDGNRDNETGLSNEEQGVIIEDTHPQHELDNPEDAYTEEIEYDEYIHNRDIYNETVKKLTEFGMWVSIDEGTYLEPIKAGEYFLSICRYINNDYFYNEDAEPEEMWKAAYEALKSLGYVDFYIDPSGEITYAQALRVLANSLGYKQIAVQSGGRDIDYIHIADGNEIAETIPADISAIMTRADAASLIEDSTEANACISPYGYGEFKYVNALEHFKKSYKITGIVESVSDMSLTGNASSMNRIKIGYYVLTTNRTDLYDYFACNVEAYYREENDGDRTLLYITYHKNNSIVTVEGEDIDSVDDSKIAYYPNNGSSHKRALLSSSAVEILNGFSPKAVKKDDFEDCDYIKLVDNNNDGRYDVVFVYKYDIMVVKRIVESQNMIYGVYNTEEKGSLKIDFNSDNVEMTDRMGNPVEAYYITKDSVLSVAKDPNSSRYKIIVSNLMYTGRVNSIIDDKKIKFEDRSYKYSTNVDYFKGSKAIAVGNTYTVYLDYRGRIAAYDMVKGDDLQYGFLIMAFVDDETGNDVASVRMLPYSGDPGVFTLAGRTRIDGTYLSAPREMLGALKVAFSYQRTTLSSIDSSYEPMDLPEGNYVYPRVPIMYKQNAEGEITYIDTPYHSEKENAGANDVFHNNTMTFYPDFSKRSSADNITPGGMYLRNTLAFNNDNGNNVAINSNTKVFVVPVSNDTSVINDYSQYTKTNLAYFTDWNYYPKTGTQYPVDNRIEAYNVDEARTAGIIVYYTSDVAPEIDKTVPLTVVDHVDTAINDEGDNVRRLVCWQGNAQTEVDLAENVSLVRYYNGPNGSEIKSEVKHGDIIRYVTNNKGELVDYVKVFSLTDEDDPDYVKTGNEAGVKVDPAALNKTMIAVSDGKYAGNGHNSPHIYTALGNYNYGATYRVVYGTLLYKSGTNLVLKTRLDSAVGQIDKIEIADFSGYNVLMIDEAKKKIYVPTEDELIAEQGAGEDASKVILHTEGGKQRQLIFIKRAK